MSTTLTNESTPRPGRGRRIAAGIAVAAVLAGSFHVFATSFMRRYLASRALNETPRLLRLPDFTYISERGSSVGRESYRGFVWIADFIFLRCGGSCPAITTAMSRLTKELAKEPRVRFVSFTVDPDHDRVEDLRAFAESVGADPRRWSFLRGERAEIRALALSGFKLGVLDGAPDDREPILHSTRFALVDREGFLRGTYESTDPDALRRLKIDARRLAAR